MWPWAFARVKRGAKILPGRRGFQGSKPIRERYRRGCGLPGISVVNSYTRKTFASPSVSLRYSSAITVVFLLRKTFAITAAKPPLLPLQNRCKHGGKNPRKTRANTVLLHGVPRCPRQARFLSVSATFSAWAGNPRKEGKRPLLAFLLVGVEVPGKTKENRPGVPSSWASIRRRSIFVLSLLFVLVSRLLFRADYPHQIGVDLGKTLFHASAVKLAWYAFIHPHPKYSGYGSGANLGG